MLLLSKLKSIDRKQKFQINSLVIGIVLYLFSARVLVLSWQSLLFLTIYVLFSLLVVHYPNLDIKSVFSSAVMPLSLLAGALASFYYFPNLSPIFKIAMAAIYMVMYYVTSLVDNIFLVVHERGEVIPLYRVAVTWSQIMIVIITIPLFAGIFKINTNSFFQSIVLFIVTFTFSYYLIWATKFDNDIKSTRLGETLLLCMFQAFIIAGTGLSISFFPGEAFLKGLTTSAVLMFLFNYISSGYLKNEVSKKIVFEYLIMFLFFLFLTFIFD